MSPSFFTLDLKEKIDAISISPYEWSKNLLCVAFKSKIVAGIIKFQEEFEDLDEEVEFETVEEFFHGPRVDKIAWSPQSSLQKLPKILQFCAAGGDFSLRVFTSDLTAKRHSRKEIEGHLSYINDCCFDPEGEFLASVSDDLTCKIWTNETFDTIATFNLTSPGMSVCWHPEQPFKLLVAEKSGVCRIYSSLTLSPMMSVTCSPAPLVQAEWPLSNHICFLAGGVLHAANLSVAGHSVVTKTVHPEGGYAIAVCPVNSNYVATVGRPNNSLKITNVKGKLNVLSADLKLFGGLSWHSRLPILVVANNASLSMYKISPK